MAPYEIPSLTSLALQYGTISEEQYRHIKSLQGLKKKNPRDPGTLLLAHQFATRYQIKLLGLIRDYLIIKKSGETFGRIAIEMGHAAPGDVKTALAAQREAFRKNRIKMIGDILVDKGIMTPEQKNEILTEQRALESATDDILDPPPIAQEPDSAPPTLSAYEKHFLKVKVLDREFAATAVEKNYATRRQIRVARQLQEDAFKKDNQLKILGDIMVEMGFMEAAQRDEILREQARQDGGETPSDQQDVPDIRVELPDHGMEARVILRKGASPGLDQIKSALADQGISTGIYPDALIQAHLDEELSTFPVAQMDFSPQLMTQIQSRLLWDHANVLDALPDVRQKGSPLVKESPLEAPYEKTTVRGEKCTLDRGKDVGYRCGSGTRRARSSMGIVADKTGIPHASIERKIHIHPTIHVLEDADLRYGPLEPYARITVSGVITGAYPVTAGDVRAREIRGAVIDAVGDVTTRLGISDATIRTQGRVKARYLHNCRIESFGSIVVEKEIFDSTLLTSGKIDAPQCRIINSTLHAKQGITLKGIGSEKTQPCIVGAGGEQHMVALFKKLNEKIDEVKETERRLEKKLALQKKMSQKVFQKMVELKIFHDRAKKKKKALVKEFQLKGKKIPEDKQKNILKLISNFETRMENSVRTLKRRNLQRKKLEAVQLKLKKKLEALAPEIQKQILSFEQDRIAFYEWARTKQGNPVIKIGDKAFQGNILKGVFSQLTLETDALSFRVEEEKKPGTPGTVLKLTTHL